MPVPVQLTVQLTIKVAGWDAANHSVSRIDQGTVIMKLQHDLLAETGGGRPRLLVVQPLVGIGDMVWHKPWIDHLAAHFDVILACKPTAKAPILFTGTDGITDWIPIERSLRGRRGRHDGPLGLLRLAAEFRRSGAEHVLIMHHSATNAMAALAARLRDFAPAMRILVMGAPSEQPIIDAVLADPAAPADLIPNSAPLDEAIALINASRLYVGNDTSLLNIAAACGRPAAGIFAQSTPLDYSDVIIPIAEPEGRFGEPGAIARITAAQAFDVVARELDRQLVVRT